jgi:hypothetical protein
MANMVPIITSALTACVGAYGHALFSKAEDQAADKTIRLGQQLWITLRGHKATKDGFVGTLNNLADNFDDPEAKAKLRLQVLAALSNYPDLARQLSEIVRQSLSNVSVQVQHNTGIISTGQRASNRIFNYGDR